MIQGYLPVSDGHTVYYEIHTKGQGELPTAIVLHGGPGSGISHHILQVFDLTKWRVILFDQRGCGKSKPFCEIKNNTTWDLIDDIERIRDMVNISSWYIVGGSWGTTLALAYAQKYPEHIKGLLLRGCCLCDEDSFRWMYEEGGVSEIFPEEWKKFLSVVPPRLHNAKWREIVKYYQKKLREKNAQQYIDAWWGWEAAVSYLLPMNNTMTSRESRALALLESNYFLNECWLRKNQILHDLPKLKNIPITIIHGRYDMVCPIKASYIIKEHLPHVRLFVIPNAGHASREPGTHKKVVQEIAKFLQMERAKTRKQKRSRACKTLRRSRFLQDIN